MPKNTNRRPQTAKSRNEPLMRAMQEKRFGNAAVKHRNKKKYTRSTDWKQDI
jgi:hypothetical protein